MPRSSFINAVVQEEPEAGLPDKYPLLFPMKSLTLFSMFSGTKNRALHLKWGFVKVLSRVVRLSEAVKEKTRTEGRNWLSEVIQQCEQIS